MAVSDASLAPGRLARTLLLIAFVTAAFLLTGAQVLPGSLFPVAVVAIGSVALVTAITGFLIAVASAADPAEGRA